ncbi:hypothetical protein GJ744_009800 [Endocarpon pusillum]|uniref:RRM domain-containing protein n=1 Tax=Endocarpon pusillum TaxID=364733 RepID=A0A8H7ATR1_9EURO|nr:hypothetical protein GJ744_009800 [Endocarpon pusillum]
MDDTPGVPETAQSGFPQSPSQFDSDPRISFSKLEEKWILETEEGPEYEYINGLKRWVPVLDQSLLEEQSKAYRVEGVDEDAPAAAAAPKKRKKQHVNGEEDQPVQKPKKARINTAVYVTSLPSDSTLEEINSVFSKCGVIAEEIDRGQPRIKMYENDQGGFKGDALIVYFRPESVNLAIQMLDDTSLRFGDAERMKVQAADFSYKSQQDAPVKSSKRDQKKVIRKTQKLNHKLADWSDDDISALQDTSSKWDKVVILKHMFTLQELEEDPAAILEIKEDIRDECSKLGQVTNVVLFDREPDGVASVRFANAEAAKACVRLMDGRWFDERQLKACVADGSEKFKKSDEKKGGDLKDEDGENGDDGGDGVGAEGDRLDKFGKWLEEENNSKRDR